jgi:hypothetical protein
LDDGTRPPAPQVLAAEVSRMQRQYAVALTILKPSGLQD